MLKVHARKFGGILMLCLEGRIVIGETEALRDAMNCQSGVSTFVLDLARVRTIDAAGLGVILRLREEARSKGVGLKLMNLTSTVSELLTITRLNSVFEIISRAELIPVVSFDPPSFQPASCA